MAFAQRFIELDLFRGLVYETAARCSVCNGPVEIWAVVRSVNDMIPVVVCQRKRCGAVVST